MLIKSRVWLANDARDFNSTTESRFAERAKEFSELLQLFVESIAPWYVSSLSLTAYSNVCFSMDMFDSHAYFGRQFPLKVKQNSMLRLAVAAVASRHITRLMDPKTHEALLPNLSALTARLHNSRDINWHYKAASYYDEGISYLRLCINQRSNMGRTSNSASVSAVAESPTEPTAVRQEPPYKKRRRQSVSGRVDEEDLLSAIAVFSLYEALNGNTEEWKQYVPSLSPFTKLTNP